MTSFRCVFGVAAVVIAGCSSEVIGPEPGQSEADQTSTQPTADPQAPPATQSTPLPSPTGSAPPATDPPAPPPTPVTAATLMAKLGACQKVSSAPYAKDAGGAATIDVCGLKNAVWFTADMDIDCDGKQSAVCNKSTDASYQSQTATTDSKGAYLDAATLPFVVVPGVSTRWSYKTSGIAMGTVVAVIYNGKVEYGIVGDVGPTSIIGEASYAMAKNLGINPNPSTGGTSSGVTYIFFTGPTGEVVKNEDHAEAVSVGQKRAAQFLSEN
ncbi:MAG: glycoside hydrolase family 75 protein [Deltaproteobacteria bacterium]|nr:glycoside hydrolase family 75 protein [Deltaproteobacteria bacterium]